MNRVRILSLVVLLALSFSCSSDRSATTAANKETRPTAGNTLQQVSGQADGSPQCDAAFWDRVYDPARLKVLDQCKVVTGVIEEQDANEDGDEHMLLKLDPGQEDLLTKRNIKKKNGDLVIEVVCANPVTDKKAVEACRGYSNPIKIPNIGDHVRVTGSYVNDTHNDWTEIHPVSRIEKM